MSAVIKTATPFTIEKVLFEALSAIGAEPEIIIANSKTYQQRSLLHIGDIVTNRSDYNGRQAFRFVHDKWVLIHDSEELSTTITSKLSDRKYIPVTQFLAQLSDAYNFSYQQHVRQVAEQERARLEAERRARVEATRRQAIAKAKALGYAVKETRNSQGQIQLVLTHMV